MLYTFDDAAAPDRRTQQYFEIMVNRGIYDHGWTAVSKSILPWQATDPAVANAFDPFTAKWELYNIDKDFSQAVDLADKEPEKLAQLQDLLWGLFAKYDVLPLQWNNTERWAGLGPYARPNLQQPQLGDVLPGDDPHRTLGGAPHLQPVVPHHRSGGHPGGRRHGRAGGPGRS